MIKSDFILNETFIKFMNNIALTTRLDSWSSSRWGSTRQSNATVTQRADLEIRTGSQCGRGKARSLGLELENRKHHQGSAMHREEASC